MAIKVTHEEFDEIRKFLAKNAGITLSEDKAYLVESRLGELMAQKNFLSFRQFLDFASKNTDESEKIRVLLLDAMTTNETTWFRDEHPFVALRKTLLPALAEELKQNKRLKVRIWCAASSTGQEPYSIAIIIREFLKNYPALNPLAFDIMATDLSLTVLGAALKGQYDTLAMNRGMPKDLLEKYFTKVGDTWVIHENIRKMVTFRKFNLIDSFLDLPHFDIIFLRNVTIYFDERFKRLLFKKMARQLSPGGLLVLGAAESLWGFSDEFDKLVHDNSVFYKVKNDLKADIS